MPPRRAVDASLGSLMHLMPPSDDRANLRSVTPRGFALAVFAANAAPTFAPAEASTDRAA
jgi:hypothetical protein